MGIGDVYAGWGQTVTIAIMAIALGMDAFSLGVGIGMKGIRLLHILQMSVLIAFSYADASSRFIDWKLCRTFARSSNNLCRRRATCAVRRTYGV